MIGELVNHTHRARPVRSESAPRPAARAHDRMGLSKAGQWRHLALATDSGRGCSLGLLSPSRTPPLAIFVLLLDSKNKH